MTNNDDHKNWKNRLHKIFEQNKSDDEAALEYLSKRATDGAGIKPFSLPCLLNKILQQKCQCFQYLVPRFKPTTFEMNCNP